MTRPNTMARLVVKMLFGSHLYGTNTPGSDIDYKGIFLPSRREILLGRVPNNFNSNTKEGSDAKNTSADIDTELYSLRYFLKLACEGQTVALDMLHAPDDMIVEKSPIWDEIVSRRTIFYTKNLNAFVGYARKQAAKYGIKGSRLSAAKSVIDILSAAPSEARLSDVWGNLPVGEHLGPAGRSPSGIDQYQVCGKILQATQGVGYTLGILNKFYDDYGHRAKLAEKNSGIDWKAVSHAVRAALQVRELLTRGTITFPLPEAETVMAIKTGSMDYITEVAPLLERLMSENERLSAESDLPEVVDRKYWDNFLISVIERYVL